MLSKSLINLFVKVYLVYQLYWKTKLSYLNISGHLPTFLYYFIISVVVWNLGSQQRYVKHVYLFLKIEHKFFVKPSFYRCLTSAKSGFLQSFQALVFPYRPHTFRIESESQETS